MMRSTLLCAALCGIGCIESADAQPRPRGDGGAWSIRAPARQAPLRARPDPEAMRRINRVLLRAFGDPDGGAFTSVLGAHETGDAYGFGGLGMLPHDGGVGAGGRIGTRGGGPVSGATIGWGSLGTRGYASDGGVASGYGGMRARGPHGTARFEDLTVDGPLPRWTVSGQLSSAAARANQCLVAAGHRAPVDVAVRFAVRRPAQLDDVVVASAPEVVERCVRESLERVILGPGEAPSQVGVWFRVGARPATP
jgi:hypothetical protein